MNSAVHTHDHEAHSHDAKQLPLVIALVILVGMLMVKYVFNLTVPHAADLTIHAGAYILAGYSVLRTAGSRIMRLDIFNEFVLMSVATIGAFCIGAFSEGVAVMVFYCIGEWFQEKAVSRAKRSIKALLDIRPEKVTVIRNGIDRL